MSKDPHQSILSPEEARRAIYIDFEGNQNRTPTLLGVLWLEEDSQSCEFYQDVLEELFWGAAQATHHRRGEGTYCTLASLDEAVEEVVDLARRENRLIVAWSQHELQVVKKYSGCPSHVLEEFDRRFRSAIPSAKRWLRATHGPRFRFPPQKKKQYRRLGTHWLDRYLQLIGYKVDHMKGWGHSGRRISYLRMMLDKYDGDFEELSGNTKSKWTNLLGHNLHDCCGMRELMLRATGAFESRFPEPCGPCTVVGSEPLT